MSDTHDRPDQSLPARRPAPAAHSAAAAEFEYDYADGPPPKGARGVSARLVWRALRRNWWQAAVLWAVGSAGLLALAYAKVRPTFDAVARLKVEVIDLSIFAKSSSFDFLQYMQTQASEVASPTTVADAIQQHPEMVGLPLLRASADPEAEVIKAVRVNLVPRTNLIQVEMSSSAPAEAAAVVNAVVDAYVKRAVATYDSSTKERIEHLKKLQEEQSSEVDKQRKVVADLGERLDAGDVQAVKERNVTTLDAYRRFSEKLTDVEILRIAAKSRLDQLRNEKVVPARPDEEREVQDAVVTAFYNDPRVASLQADIESVERKFREVNRSTKKKTDPALVRQAERLKELKAKKDEYWQKLSGGLRRQVLAQPADAGVDQLIKEAEGNLAATATQEETLRSKLEHVKIENKTAQSDALKLEYARTDLKRAEDVFNKICENLAQLEFEAKNPISRVQKDFPARTTNVANSDRRTQVMAAAPVATGLLVLGVLVLMELRGGRVSDPDEISGRLNLPVIGVVPPLPQIRSGQPGGGGDGDGGGALVGQADLRAQRQLDEFVQSLDHLRVALCARRDPWGRDRHCVLITSACGSEGKTTLAAQLAERCVNAGMMTLLIDGDLRNPTLSRMLDAADNPGLINVLRGEVAAEDVVMVIGDAGGFHLLPAGTPRVDPSRLLQSERLGKLIAAARESFDMIIVDAPPVLPVPDALTIGRWTDGAVLAVRHDTSRFPLVERANRRLAHVGVPVIGAVVNGVRSMEAAYGGGYGYAYGSYGSTVPEPAPSAASAFDD